MSEKYKITKEEINQILMHSPFALSDAPYQKGLGSGQIKKYFYDFISVLASKLNARLESLGIDLNQIVTNMETALENKGENILGELDRAILSVVESVTKSLSELEKENGDAHGEFQSEIEKVQEALSTALPRLLENETLTQSAYNLATGKSKVHIAMDLNDMFGMLPHVNANVGDFLMVIDRNCPDFVVIDTSYKPVAVKVSYADIMSGKVPAVAVGGKYYLEYTSENTEKICVIMAIESGVDASSFATKEQFESVDEALEQLDKSVSDFVDYALEKIEKMATKQELEEALQDVSSGGENWELISTLTLETSSLSQLNFDVDNNGNSFKLKKLRILIESDSLEENGGAYTKLTVNLYGKVTQSTYGRILYIEPLPKEANKYARGFFDVEVFAGGFVLAKGNAKTNATSNANDQFKDPNNTSSNTIVKIATDYIDSFRLATNEPMHSGTKFTVWGIRTND